VKAASAWGVKVYSIGQDETDGDRVDSLPKEL